MKIDFLRSIKNKAKLLKLPILERKWDQIDDDKIYKHHKRNFCFELYRNGCSVKDVINHNISSSLAYITYKIYKDSIKERDIKRDLDRNL